MIKLLSHLPSASAAVCFEMREKLVDSEDIFREMRRKFSRLNRVAEIYTKNLIIMKIIFFNSQTLEHGIFQVL